MTLDELEAAIAAKEAALAAKSDDALAAKRAKALFDRVLALKAAYDFLAAFDPKATDGVARNIEDALNKLP